MKTTGKKGTLKAIRDKLNSDSESQELLFRVSDTPLKQALFTTDVTRVLDETGILILKNDPEEEQRQGE